MKRGFLPIIVLGLVAAFLGLEFVSYAKSSDEAKIRAVVQNFAAAFRAKDLDKIMSFYEPGDKLVAFDLVPPRQFVGWDAYKKDWQDFLSMFSGPITYDLIDLSVATDGNLAYSHNIEHIAGDLKDGGKLDLTVRVTDVYRKTGGKWLIVHEHVSVPVDLSTGKADLQSKP